MTHLPAGQGPVLQVQNLSKEYRLYDSPRARLKALLTGRTYHRSHWALQDVDFALAPGECLGVIGNNGAGKSTLLKLITGTLQPTRGAVTRVGRLTAILELGAGFHPDFTGRENLYFGGNLIGISTEQMRGLEAEIIAFSELGQAIDRPVKTYSSGMAVRLAFALVTAVEPDLLIIDEALAVGDQHFQKKCVERIDAFRRNGCSILFCSHSLYHVRQLCGKAVWLEGGQVRAFGDCETVLASYEAFVRQQEQGDEPIALSQPLSMAPDRTEPPPAGLVPLAAEARAAIVSVAINDLETGEPPQLTAKDLRITVLAQVKGGECPSIGVMLEQAHGVGITSVATHADGVRPQPLADGLWRATLTFPDLPLHTGDYVLSVYLFDNQGLVVYEERLHCAQFRFVQPSLTPGLVRLPHYWA